MKKVIILISASILLLINACDSLYFTEPMPKAGKTVNDFPWEFCGEYRMLENIRDSVYIMIRIEEKENRKYHISFSDSGLFRDGFILDLKEELYIELDKKEQAEDSSKLTLREHKGHHYLSWFKEEYQGWQLLRFDIGRDSLRIKIPQFEALLLSDFRDIDQNDFLANATDQELANILDRSDSYAFERVSPLKYDPSYFVLGAIALILLGIFMYLSRRKK